MRKRKQTTHFDLNKGRLYAHYLRVYLLLEHRVKSIIWTGMSMEIGRHYLHEDSLPLSEIVQLRLKDSTARRYTSNLNV